MTLAEKLKCARKRAGWSQEQLAEKIGVSRQTVTKWECDAGIPDIANLTALAALLRLSVDELLSDAPVPPVTLAFESLTEYDVDHPKRFDFKIGGAKRVEISSYDGEKLRLLLSSPTLSTLQTDVKLKIDDNRNNLDVDLHRYNALTETEAKRALNVQIQLPRRYLTRVEIAVNAHTVQFRTLECDVEFDGKAAEIVLEGVVGVTELNCGQDVNIDCRTLNGSVELNQISATSRITLPADVPFRAVKRGIGNKILYEREGMFCAPFSDDGADNVIELNGLKSELVIARES